MMLQRTVIGSKDNSIMMPPNLLSVPIPQKSNRRPSIDVLGKSMMSSRKSSIQIEA
mgnify:CR=1 FL=1